MGDNIDKWLDENTTKFGRAPDYYERQRIHQSSKDKYLENKLIQIRFGERKTKKVKFNVYDDLGHKIGVIEANSLHEARAEACRYYYKVARVEEAK